MPWCEPCGRFYNPNTLRPDGTCPHNHLVQPPKRAAKVPWHFWLLLAAVTIYLTWRIVQGIGWLVSR